MAPFSYPAWNLVRLDRDGPTPLYEQLYAQIRSLASRGQLTRGARLPPTRLMAGELGVSRMTVVLAYEKLASEGYVARRAGAGTFVERLLPEDHVPPRASRPAGPPARYRPSRRGRAAADTTLPSERRNDLLFSPGVPALAEFPYDVFARLASRHWRTHAATHTGYDYARGLPELSRQVAAYLNRARGVACRAEQIMVVSSSIQAVSLAAYALLDPGDAVLTEDPGHRLSIATLEAWGLVVRPIALDEAGLDVTRADMRGLHARLAIVTPAVQFPFGCTMSSGRRAALLDWATSRGGWILEDDINSEIRWAGVAPPPLVASDPHRVVYVGSFNRVLAPGLRLAYLVVPLHLIEVFGQVQRLFSFYAPRPDGALVADFMSEGRLASHLRRMRGIYRERAAAMTRHLRDRLGDVFEIPEVEAGLHLTLRARGPFDDAAAAVALAERGFDCPALSAYYRGAAARRGLVLGFGSLGAERVGGAVAQFAKVVRAKL